MVILPKCRFLAADAVRECTSRDAARNDMAFNVQWKVPNCTRLGGSEIRPYAGCGDSELPQLVTEGKRLTYRVEAAQRS